jgi:transposase-like protein
MASNRRTFTVGFKQQVVQELMAGATFSQASRKYEISVSVIRRWKEQLAAGQLQEGPTPRERALEARIGQLERMVGRLTMENEFLKKVEVWKPRKRNGGSLIFTGKSVPASDGGAGS